jgi:hypothetical protein
VTDPVEMSELGIEDESRVEYEKEDLATTSPIEASP